MPVSAHDKINRSETSRREATVRVARVSVLASLMVLILEEGRAYVLPSTNLGDVHDIITFQASP